MRKLVTVRTVDEINPIPNADAIDVATVDGWNVVVKKGEFQPGDPCVFFEIDSFLPADDERFAFLAAKGTKKDPSGRERVRLKTIKLRKQISQGLALPIAQFPELRSEAFTDIETGEYIDYSETLDVIKYERPEPQSANSAGNFPDFAIKSDEERVQNLYKLWKEKKAGVVYTPTLKLDGSSMTVIYISALMPEHWKDKIFRWTDDEQAKAYNTLHGQYIVCSRNLALKYDPDNHFWKAFHADENAIPRACTALAKETNNRHPIILQFECMGPGIQGNKEKLNDYRAYLFAMQNPDERGFYPWAKLTDLLSYIRHDLHVVPEYEPKVLFDMTLDEILAHADGPSINAKNREGIVWKGADGSSVKAISNKWLLKDEE